MSRRKIAPETWREKLGLIQETAKTYAEIEGSKAPQTVKIRLADMTGDMMGKIMRTNQKGGYHIEATVEKSSERERERIRITSRLDQGLLP